MRPAPCRHILPALFTPRGRGHAHSAQPASLPGRPFVGRRCGAALHAEPPPETTTVRLPKFTPYCLAPQYVAEDMLRAEGFSDVQFIESAGADSPNWPADGELDFNPNFPVAHAAWWIAASPRRPSSTTRFAR
jgi:hypothetical protein